MHNHDRSRITVAIVALATLSGVARADEVRDFILRPIPQEVAEFKEQAKQGQALLHRLGPNHRGFVAVSFRTGSLLYLARDWSGAEGVYRKALSGKKLTPTQEGRLWLNVAQCRGALNDPEGALTAYKKVGKFKKLLTPDERSSADAWVSRLELRSPGSDLRVQTVRSILAAIKRGDFKESMPGDIQWIYEHESRFGPTIMSAIAERLANGHSDSDFELWNAAVSVDARFEEGIVPNTFGKLRGPIERRMAGKEISAAALLAKSQWLSGRQDAAQDAAARQRNLEDVARQVRLLTTGFFTEDQREYGMLLVNLMESMSSKEDLKANALIKQALIRLRGESVGGESESVGESKSMIPALMFASASTLGAGGFTFLVMRRKRVSRK